MAPMETNTLTLALYALGAAALIVLLAKLRTRLELSMAKHPSLTGHSRMARRIAALIPFYEFDERQFFRSDDAPDEIAERRRAGFMRLAGLYRERFAATRQATAKVKDVDLRPAVHRRLPRALPVQPAGARESGRRDVRASPPRASRSPTSTATASTISPAPTASTCSATTSTRSAWSAGSPACASWAPCSAPIIRWSPTTCSG